MQQDLSVQANNDLSLKVKEYLEKVSVDEPLSADQQNIVRQQIKQLLIDKNAVIVAHYYTDPLIQALDEATGGVVADSLSMARLDSRHDAVPLIVVGVKLLGE